MTDVAANPHQWVAKLEFILTSEEAEEAALTGKLDAEGRVARAVGVHCGRCGLSLEDVREDAAVWECGVSPD